MHQRAIYESGLTMKLIYSLRFRLSVLYILTIVLPISIIMFAMPAYYQTVISKETTTLTEGTLASLTRNIDTYLDDLERLTTAVSYQNPEFLKALDFRNSSQYDMSDNYTKFKTEDEIYYTLAYNLQLTRQDIIGAILITNDGTPFITNKNTDPSNVNSKYIFSDQDWYKKAVSADGKVVFISAHLQDYLQSKGQAQVFSVARLIKDPDSHKWLGVIMADADTIVLEKIFSGVNFNVTSIVSIFDDNNNIIYSNKGISQKVRNQILNGDRIVKDANDSYLTVSKPIERAGWKMVVLSSYSELESKVWWVYAAGILFAVGGLILAFSLFFTLSRVITNPFKKMISVMKEVEKGNLKIRFKAHGKDELSHLGNALSNMVIRLDELIDREYRAVLSKRNAEYYALQSQVQPHFLYNTLNGFIGLNRLGDRDTLEKAIFALTGMLRYTLEHSDWATISEEFLLLQRYGDLQKLRFQDRLEISIHYDDSIAKYKIPKLLLQPLVENAIIHGIEPLHRNGRVDISAEIKHIGPENVIQISIADNGVGFDLDFINEKKNIGLSNVRERLIMAYSEAGFSLSSRLGEGTTVIIEIPEKEVKV